MKQNINIEKIMAIHRQHGELPFNMALQHLFDSGKLGFTEKAVTSAKESTKKNASKNSIMTADYQSNLIDISYELSKFPTWDILLYLKLYVSIQGDNLVQLQEAEHALSTWDNKYVPKLWTVGVSDPEMRHDILLEMVNSHTSEYTRSEIEAAIYHIVDENELLSE